MLELNPDPKHPLYYPWTREFTAHQPCPVRPDHPESEARAMQRARWESDMDEWYPGWRWPHRAAVAAAGLLGAALLAGIAWRVRGLRR